MTDADVEVAKTLKTEFTALVEKFYINSVKQFPGLHLEIKSDVIFKPSTKVEDIKISFNVQPK